MNLLASRAARAGCGGQMVTPQLSTIFFSRTI